MTKLLIPKRLKYIDKRFRCCSSSLRLLLAMACHLRLPKQSNNQRNSQNLSKTHQLQLLHLRASQKLKSLRFNKMQLQQKHCLSQDNKANQKSNNSSSFKLTSSLQMSNLDRAACPIERSASRPLGVLKVDTAVTKKAGC